MAGGSLTRAAKLFKISRILKVFRLVKMSKFMEDHADDIEMWLITSNFTPYISLFKLMVMMFYICHVMGCSWAGIAYAATQHYPNDEDPPHSWAAVYYDGDDTSGRLVAERWITRDFKDGDVWFISSAYLTCFYWAMTTITTVGYGDICPENDGERLFAIASMVIGGAFCAFNAPALLCVCSHPRSRRRLPHWQHHRHRHDGRRSDARTRLQDGGPARVHDGAQIPRRAPGRGPSLLQIVLQ